MNVRKVKRGLTRDLHRISAIVPRIFVPPEIRPGDQAIRLASSPFPASVCTVLTKRGNNYRVRLENGLEVSVFRDGLIPKPDGARFAISRTTPEIHGATLRARLQPPQGDGTGLCYSGSELKSVRNREFMTLVIVDGSNALYRFGFAHLNLRARDGTATGAVYGILGLLPRLKKLYPDAIFVMVWEGAGKSWRHRFWDGYKANRPKQKSEDAKIVLSQKPMVEEICGMMGIPQLSVPEMEADDLIGLVAFALCKKHPVIVYSSDKDFLQLMNFGIRVIRDVKKEKKLDVETERTIEQDFGCCSGDVLMVRAIAGDKSDGIPNPVYGIGPKKAAGYLRTGEWPESLITNWQTVQRNYRLMRILTSVRSRELSGQQQMEVHGCIAKVMDLAMARRCPSCGGYEQWIRLLGQYDLQEALEDRQVLWRIQK